MSRNWRFCNGRSVPSHNPTAETDRTSIGNPILDDKNMGTVIEREMKSCPYAFLRCQLLVTTSRPSQYANKWTNELETGPAVRVARLVGWGETWAEAYASAGMARPEEINEK